MLRTRSGEGPSIEPPAAGEDALAEMGKVVADARLEITRLVQLGELQHDPIRHPIEALSVHLEALYKVASATVKTLTTQAVVVSRPVDDDKLRHAVAQGIHGHATGLIREFGLRTSLMFAGLLLAALLLGAGGGYVFRGSVPVLVGVKAGAEKCDDRADGSRLCWIPVFERLPQGK